MALRDTIAMVAAAAFNAVGNIKTDVVYLSRKSTYTPATGTVTPTDSTINLSGIIIPPGPIRKSITQNRDESIVNANEVRIIIKQSDMSGTVPVVDDIIVIDGSNWFINEISWDPAGATYTFKIKKK
jgi:Rieske Fe-S protein